MSSRLNVDEYRDFGRVVDGRGFTLALLRVMISSKQKGPARLLAAPCRAFPVSVLVYSSSLTTLHLYSQVSAQDTREHTSVAVLISAAQCEHAVMGGSSLGIGLA